MDFVLYGLQIAVEGVSLATVGGLGLVALAGSILLLAVGAE
jgi:hypothetical protein